MTVPHPPPPHPEGGKTPNRTSRASRKPRAQGRYPHASAAFVR
jgi:hypothetical protein